MLTAVVADSQVVKCNRFSHQQSIHSLRSLQAPERYLTDKQARSKSFEMPGLKVIPKSVHPAKTDTSITQVKTKSSPSQYIPHQDRYINNSGQDKVIPESVHPVKTDTSITQIKTRSSQKSVHPVKTDTSITQIKTRSSPSQYIPSRRIHQ